MGRSMIDLACLAASFSQKFHNREFRQTSESLGGSAHGSQYNTRVAYMTAKGHSEYSDRYENVQDDLEFEYYDEHVFDAMEQYLKQARKCPSMTFTHDFGDVYNNLMTVVGEAQSGSLDAEDLKLTLGGC